MELADHVIMSHIHGKECHIMPHNRPKPLMQNRPTSTTINDMYQLGSITARGNIITDQLLQWIV
jgi:hypothetical protein